jgi:hypothetical protein
MQQTSSRDARDLANPSPKHLRPAQCVPGGLRLPLFQCFDLVISVVLKLCIVFALSSSKTMAIQQIAVLYQQTISRSDSFMMK